MLFVMDLLSLAFSLIGRVPWERIFIRQRDTVASMERMARTLTPEKGTLIHLEPPTDAKEDLLAEKSPDSLQAAPVSENPTKTSETPREIATACVPCALGHFSRSAGALNEAMRFKDEGISSNEVLDRLASVLEEQNALERFDLTPEKLQGTPAWEREIAEEALKESRKLRHRLEGIQSIEELEKAAADTAAYYKNLNRAWYRGRFSHLGEQKVAVIEKRISPEEM